MKITGSSVNEHECIAATAPTSSSATQRSSPIINHLGSVQPSALTLSRGHKRNNAVDYQIKTTLDVRKKPSSSTPVNKSTTTFVNVMNGERFTL